MPQKENPGSDMLPKNEPSASRNEGMDVPAGGNAGKNAKKYGAIFTIAFLACALLYFLNDYYSADRVEMPKNAAQENGSPAPAHKDEDKGAKLFSFSLVKPVFASYQPEAGITTPAIPFQKPKRGEMANLNAFESKFSEKQIAALEEEGFFLTKNSFESAQDESSGGKDDFADAYRQFTGDGDKYFREPQNSLYISSDLALHLYHILVDRSFQRIEEQKFQPMLKDMTKALFDDSLKKYNEAANPELKENYKQLSVYYLVPLVVLDSVSSSEKLSPDQFPSYAKYVEAVDKLASKPTDSLLEFSLKEKKYDGYDLSDEVYALASQELSLVKKAEGLTNSPLFTPLRPDFVNDYSQFKPRSHYTKNDILKSYFIAMMWYGRMGFSLNSPALTRDAIIITGQVNSLEADGKKIAKDYADLSSAIEFFVGQVDDLTPYEYTEQIKKVYGDDLSSEELADNGKLDEFISSSVKEMPLPKVVSDAVTLYDNGGKRDELLKQLMQFRFLGQRFTPDAYVLSSVTQGVGEPDPETGQMLPSMSSALMPIKVIIGGKNDTVNSYVDGWIKENAPDSDRIFAKKFNQLAAEFAGYDEKTWTQNVYWNWLNCYRSLLGGYGQGYPAFMTTDAWQKKNLGTVLGSYAELKHDTLLYAKQSYAEMGGGGPEEGKLPPVPKGYVEADPVFWQRISALAKMTDEGLKERGIMPEYFGEKYDNFIENAEFFNSIVQKEIVNSPVSEDEFEKLRLSGSKLSFIADPLPGEELTTRERRAGIIADIHTDAVDGKILYEATGRPYMIYVAVKDANGARIARGLVYGHYELDGPLATRLSDEDWQAKVYDGKGELPKGDSWTQDLLK